MLGYMAENTISGLCSPVQWSDVASLQAEHFRVLDVRSRSEFAQGSILGALNIPLDELRERTSEIPREPLIVTCAVGQRGHTATLLLQDHGFDVVNLDGGYQTWSHSPAGLAAVAQQSK